MTQARRSHRAGGPTVLVVALVALALLAAACSSSGPSSLGSHALIRAGRPLPAVTVAGYDGHDQALRDLRGRALVLNFWARSCAPCAEEMPALQASYRSTPGDRVRFLGVDASEPESVGRSFARSLGVTYPLAGDPKGTLMAGLGVSSLPTTVFVDPGGTVRAVHVGRLSAADLQSGLVSVGAV
jgi:peroxiredoxin